MDEVKYPLGCVCCIGMYRELGYGHGVISDWDVWGIWDVDKLKCVLRCVNVL